MYKRGQDKKPEEVSDSFDAEAVPHMKALFRVAMCLERDRGKAEELVEVTYMQAWCSFHLFEPGANCRAWLVAIMYRVRQRRQRKFSPLH